MIFLKEQKPAVASSGGKKQSHRKNGLKLQQQFLQLIDEDVGHPHISGRYRNLFDLIKVFWVPDQEFICPRLNYSRMRGVK